MSGDVNIQISNDVVKGIIQKKLEMAVAGALGDEPELLNTIVRTALEIKVDRDGKKPSYASSSDIDLIEWLCRSQIQAVARKCIQEWVEAQRPKIEVEIKKAMEKQTKNLAADFVSCLATNVKKDWNYSIDLKLIPKKAEL